MITPHELFTVVNELGIDPAEIASGLAKTAATQTGAKLFGGSRLVVQHLIRQVRRWKKSAALARQLENCGDTQRSAVLASGFEEWVKERSNDAIETTHLLYRLVYLRALKAHCNTLPIVGSVGAFSNLLDAWVPQNFRRASRLVRDDGKAKNATGQKLFENLLEGIAAARTPIVVVGGAGSGKSTQLRKLVADKVDHLLSSADFDAFVSSPLPAYVTARDILAPARDLTTSLGNALVSSLQILLPFPIPSGFFDPREPGAPRCYFLVVDGFDEVDAEARQLLGRKLEMLAQNHSVIIGSRPDSCWSNFEQLEILDFSDAQAELLVRKVSPRHILGDAIDKKALPRNPLLLTLATLLAAEDISSYAALYHEFSFSCLAKGRNAGVLTADIKSIWSLLERCATETTLISSGIENFAADLTLIQRNLPSLERRKRTRDLLLATGLVTDQGGHLTFVHDSFRSYFRGEQLARSTRPSQQVWSALSPFKEGWETISFVIEAWMRDGNDIAPALGAILAFGDPGLRLISGLAARSPQLPIGIVDAAVAKWTYRDDDFWQPGHINGPIQQLTLIAKHYEAGRRALRRIADDSFTYMEDAAYAARGLHEVGCHDEAKTLLGAQARNQKLDECHRVQAAELLIEIGAIDAAHQYLVALEAEWQQEPPDLELAWMRLAEALHKLGKKRTASSILRKLSIELHEELDLRFLAESYLLLGKRREAAKAARRAFETMNWSTSLLHGYNHEATELAELLETVGAGREAAFVRKRLDRSSDHDTERLQKVAFDFLQDAQRRYDCATELAARGRAGLALDALEAMLHEHTLPHYERFRTVPPMLDLPGGRERAVRALKKIAKDEPKYRTSCGTALLLSAAVEDGVAILRRVALEPAETSARRVEAITQLAQSGHLDLAAAGVRRLRNSNAMTSNNLRQLADTFAHTPIWAEFLRMCEALLNSGDAAIRIQAVQILMQAPSLWKNRSQAINVLRTITKDQSAAIDDRIAAASNLDDIDSEDAAELLFDITVSPTETLEAGAAAMDCLSRLGEEFLALDGGHDVVWDAKLSVDQFIEAAHRFLAATSRARPSEDKDLAEDISDAIVEKLQKIASNSATPLERRLAAAGIRFEDKIRDTPLWPVLLAICDDANTPITYRWPAIRCAVKRNPSLMEQYKTLRQESDLSPLEVSSILLAADWRDAAAEQLHAALACEPDHQVRVRILTQLAELMEIGFSGHAAADLLENLLDTNDVDSECLANAFLLMRGVLSDDKILELAVRVAENDQLEAYTVQPALRIIAELRDLESVLIILRRRVATKSAQISSNTSAFYSLIHLHHLQASYGVRSEASVALTDLSLRANLNFEQKVHACRALARIGCASAAVDRLRTLAKQATDTDRLLTVATAAAESHDWGLSRRMLLAVARDKSSTPNAQIIAARGLGQVGLMEPGRNVLALVSASDLGRYAQNAIEALAACGQHEKAVALCQSHVTRTDVDALDRVEIFGKLGECYRKDVAGTLLVDWLRKFEGDVAVSSRGAEILYDLGCKIAAQTTLMDLKLTADQDIDDRIWLADAMTYCGLIWSARHLVREAHEAEAERLEYVKRAIADTLLTD